MGLWAPGPNTSRSLNTPDSWIHKASVPHWWLQYRYCIHGCSVGISSVAAVFASHRWPQCWYLVGGCSIGTSLVVAVSVFHPWLQHRYHFSGCSICISSVAAVSVSRRWLQYRYLNRLLGHLLLYVCDMIKENVCDMICHSRFGIMNSCKTFDGKNSSCATGPTA